MARYPRGEPETLFVQIEHRLACDECGQFASKVYIVELPHSGDMTPGDQICVCSRCAQKYGR